MIAVELKEGDVVRLKSGGPQMTVSGIGNYSPMGAGPDDDVLCVWFDGKKEATKVFRKVVLERIDE